MSGGGGGGLAFAADHKNGNFPDDLMLLILLRCPVKAIFRFKCVSKTWQRNLSHSSFRDAYVSFQKELGVRQHLLGLFNFTRHPPRFNCCGTIIEPAPDTDEEGPPGFSFLPTHIQGQPLTMLPFVDGVGSFRAISNGLVLCGDHPNFHVFNPITRQLFSLPRACIDVESMNRNGAYVDYQAASPGFFSSEFDNDFQVIVPIVDERLSGLGEKFVQVEMYSSKTGFWKESKLVAAYRFHVLSVLPPTSIDGGTFLWITSGVVLMIYDPHRVDDHALLIRAPSPGLTHNFPTLCQSSDEFLQCTVDSKDFPGFRVFTLAKKLDSYGYEAAVSSKEWVLTYDVQLDTLDAIWTTNLNRAYYRQHDRYVIRMAYHPLNPLVIFFRMGAKIFSCDVENGQLNRIPHGGHHFFTSELFLLRPYVQPHWPLSPLPKDM